MSALADRLAKMSPELAARSIAEMYANPFWDARFGARGRKFSDEDGLHHVRHLVEALRAEQPELMTSYARWLQGVLTTRGMCSLHLAENFDRLGRAIEAAAIPEHSPAIAMLSQASAALRYVEGPEAALPESANEQARIHLSYLGDALHLAQPQVFLDHLAWWGPFRESQGDSPEQLARLLETLRSSLPATAPPAIGALLDRGIALARSNRTNA